jgi:hypothetical protein
MEFKVVDENDNEVPVGEKGSSSAGGPGRTPRLNSAFPRRSKEKDLGGWLRAAHRHREPRGVLLRFRKCNELGRAGDYIQTDQRERIIQGHPDGGEGESVGVHRGIRGSGESDLVCGCLALRGKNLRPK